MLVDGLPSCTATVIHSSYLLTAASSVREFIYQLPSALTERKWFRIFNFTTFQYVIRFGNNAFFNFSDPLPAENMVEEIIFYPYEMNEPFHNIAILKLVNPVTFNSPFAPVCFPPKKQELQGGTKCVAVGWKSNETSTY
ncbi:hypothetical protein ACTXT7_015662 [Hymenolepis weldensis]